VIDFIHKWANENTALRALQIVGWLGISRSKYYDWKERYGKANEHNAQIPRDHWIESWEQEAIIDFARKYPLEGYRRLTFMMLDKDVVSVSPSTTYRVLKTAGLIEAWNCKVSKKGTGFVQPLRVHEHWHVDISYINVAGTFYYLCSLLDGCSRAIVHHELRQSMTEAEIEIIIQRALEKYPGQKPRIISDNGPQFIAKDFKEFVRIAGLTHVKTSPYYPQSNGKIERWHKSLKTDCIRPGTPLNLDQAKRLIGTYVQHYNTVRLHSAIGYITPESKLLGNELAIFAQRDQKLAMARHQRKIKRQNQPALSLAS
jgi:putative transposase